MIDDLLFRQVCVLQANLKILESNSKEVGVPSYIKDLKIYKSRLAKFIKAKVNAVELPRDPLTVMKKRLENISKFFFTAENEYKKLINWKLEWLESYPVTSLKEIKSAILEFDKIAHSFPQIQQQLKNHLSLNDWRESHDLADLHPEILVCAKLYTDFLIRDKLRDREALYHFANNKGPLVSKVVSHFDAIRLRLNELVKLHELHEKILNESSMLLDNCDFRKAQSVFGKIEKIKFIDLDYESVESKINHFIDRSERLNKLKKILNRSTKFETLKVVQSDLIKLEDLGENADAQFKQEYFALMNEIENKLDKVKNSKRKRLSTILISSILACTLIVFYIFEKRADEDEFKQSIERQYDKFRGNSAGEEKIIEIAPGVTMVFSWCPPGDFMMGSPLLEEGRGHDEDQVKVVISRGFWMAKTEVTQAQWHAIMKSNPAHFRGDNLPIENVSWYDVQRFINKLNANLGNSDEGKISLPTEAQWEYAARAGVGDSRQALSLREAAWHHGNSQAQTHPVGTKKPNAWGLYDMLGNVWEWCSDWYDKDLSKGVDPKGANEGLARVYRGGGWSNGGGDVWRVAERSYLKPTITGASVGFRVLLKLAIESPHDE